MRPLRLFLSIGPAATLAVCSASVAFAGESVRVLTIVNAGTEPVYALRIGHRGEKQWSEDLLLPSDVIDVGELHSVRVRFTGTCWYDVRAEYGDGHAREIDDVDLCAVKRLTLDH